MKADQVEMTWDAEKRKWLVRIKVGEEVIRRFCKEGKDASEQELFAAAQKTAVDEGYDVEPGKITVRR
jgi:hypothetical protein